MLRKSVYLFALLAVLFAQLVTAHHHASHLVHDGFVADLVAFDHSGHDNHDDQKQQHQCPECLLTKSLQIALHNDQTLKLTLVESASALFGHDDYYASTIAYRPHNARAPPSFLI